MPSSKNIPSTSLLEILARSFWVPSGEYARWLGSASVEFVPVTGSDHRSVVAELVLPVGERP